MNIWALIFGSELAFILALLRFLTLFAADVDADNELDALLLAFSLLFVLLSISAAAALAEAVFPFFLTPADVKSMRFSPSTPSVACERLVKLRDGSGGGCCSGCAGNCFNRFLSTKPGLSSTGCVESGENLFFTADNSALCDE